MAPVAVALVLAWLALSSAPAVADQVRLTEWWLPELHITAAQQTSQGSGVTIAVLDTGVDAAAPDLAGSVLSGPDLSHSGRAANGPFFGIRGTEIASIIAGHGHGPGNGDGLIGVAPAAKILSVRVALDSGDPTLGNPAITSGLPAAIASGIRYATNNGASVIDLPLDPAAAGAAGPAGLPSLAVSSPAEQSAVAYARSKGVVLVAPAGDDGAGPGIINYPAAYHGVISVGAFDKNFTKAPFSSHQSYVTMTAAGDGIAAETPSGYTTVGSTSAASAVVAGIAALIRSAFPALTPAQVTKSLISSTRFRRPNGRQIGSGYGTVDALAALRAATAMAEPHGQRAFTGSVARVAPMIPTVRAARNDLRAKLERDAILSAGVLLILLVPAVMLAIVRRRSRAEDPEFDDSYDDLEQQLANAGAGLPEQLEFLPAPSPATGPGHSFAARGPGGAAGPGSDERLAGPDAFGGANTYAGAGSYVAPSSFTGASGMASASSHPDAGLAAFPGRLPPPAGRPAPAPGTVAGPGTGPGHGDRVPRPRGINGRAKVSGNPPWEPAAKPESELPWAAVPAPPAATPFGAASPRPVPSAGSLWDAAGAADRAQPAAAPDAAGAEEAGAGNGGGDPADDPMSVWSQAETTETFPAIGEDTEG